MSFLRWQDGKKIGFTKLVPEFRESFGAPYYVVHRAHFHDALHRCALKLGVKLRVNSKVQAYDAEAGTVKLTNGVSYTGDLVVAADGNFQNKRGRWGKRLKMYRDPFYRSKGNSQGKRQEAFCNRICCL